MKIYLIYLKKDKSLYAYTSVKEYLDRFLIQRNPKCFIVKKVKMSEPEQKSFMYTHRLLQLNIFPYQTEYSETGYVDLASTSKEDDNITAKIEEIESYILSIKRLLNTYHFKSKYRKSIERLISIDDPDENLYTIDMLELFIDIHRDTFIDI